MSTDKWNEWTVWHKDWKERYSNAIKEVKQSRGYKHGEKQEAFRQIRKEYMNEFWISRKKILGV